jgi:GcrA cell cycle regulator
MVDMLKAGESFEQIGAIVGMSRHGVAHRATKYGMRSSYSVGRWTPEKVEQLIQLFETGLSSTGIAARLEGMSRNAVIGKLTRLGLTNANGFKRKKGGDRSQKVQEFLGQKQHQRQAPVSVLPTLKVADVVPLHLSLLDLGPDQCRYPFGDGPFTFCGCEKIEGSSYCEPHHRLTHLGAK